MAAVQESGTGPTRRPRYERGLHEVADGVLAYLQPDGGWGWSNAGLICGDGASLLVDTLFDARLYVSPLIDAKGQQSGWMTSMTNITEAKRIRDQLAASHERFTTVLEGLDAAVSVLSVQHSELLFGDAAFHQAKVADLLIDP